MLGFALLGVVVYLLFRFGLKWFFPAMTAGGGDNRSQTRVEDDGTLIRCQQCHTFFPAGQKVELPLSSDPETAVFCSFECAEQGRRSS
jgi:hypothetical protein